MVSTETAPMVTPLPHLLEIKPPQPVVGPSPLALDDLSLHDDTFLLGAGAGLPAIRVDLLLSSQQTSADGQLVVTDLAGQLLYSLPLDHVDALHAELPIAAPGLLPANLGIDLLVIPAPSGMATPGRFEIAIYWNQTSPVTSAPTQPSSSVGSTPPGSASPATFNLTTINGTPAVAPPVPPATPSMISSQYLPGFALTNGAGGDASPRQIPGTLPASAHPPGLPGNNPGPFGPQSSASAIQSPKESGPQVVEGSGLGTETRASARPANLGLLPLSTPIPDGGIFAYPGSGSKEPDNDVVPTFTLEPATIIDGAVAPRTVVEVAPRSLDLDFALMPFSPNFPLQNSRRVDLEPSSEMTGSGTGTLILPPLALLAAGPSSGKTDESAGSVPLAPSSRPVRVRPSIGVGLIGTAALFLGLVAPDCVTRLAVWREDRRSLSRTASARLAPRRSSGV